MAKKRSASSVRARRARKSVRHMPDRDIDFSDIPEMTDEELRRARRVGRPTLGEVARQLIAIRIDPNLLNDLRKEADQRHVGYQTLIHEILSEHAHKQPA